ncbi:hypothetical protein NQ317_000117 [Molorchus minor]|uniref:Carboxylic ester hydrolase n=1 Tax=Molorchus minor TaxID=1323400 RepID=A0ABQ9JVR7_9CUCU|nr:hypothetical protein NQ317_000117 [Molorchus minor]
MLKEERFWIKKLSFPQSVKSRQMIPSSACPPGQIRGVATTTQRNGQPYYAYLGIPFAAPPVGNLRFQPPQPVASWDGILDTQQYNNMCYQVGNDNSLETEDCLYINVYTPEAPGTNAALPVMFNIYGGGYVHGYAGGLYGPQFVVEQDVVVVSINYREIKHSSYVLKGNIGIRARNIRFLSTGDTVIPGNMGLKDQQFGLKWVQENIHLFGGDPTKVTIMGQSAGAASVTFQILSPGSSGLFRAGIAESGSALCGFAYQRNPVDTAYGVAAAIDPTFTNDKTSQELLEFLQSVDAKAIDNTADQYKTYAPVIEVEHDGAFITESMYEAVKNGRINKVPLVIGINSEEQIAHAADLDNLKKTMRNYEKNVQLLVSDDMNIDDSDTRTAAGEAAKEIYTDGLFQDDPVASIEFLSDSAYVRAIIRYAEWQSHYTDVYFYQFSYHGLLGGNDVSLDGLGKVAHAEDTKYLWSKVSGTDLSSYPASDITTLDRYVALFTNFAKTLNPTPETTDLLQNVIWPKASSDQYYYLDIDENLQIKENPREFSYRKWVELYDTYANEPLISY